MLMAAATHYGLKGEWRMRKAWAAERRQLFRQIAANPLDQLDHWKHAADPWQFLQVVKGIADHLEDDRRLAVSRSVTTRRVRGSGISVR